MPALDRYTVTLKTETLGQTCLNVFTFSQTLGTDNADNLGDLFVADYIPDIQLIMATNVVFRQLTVKNEDDASDFHVRSLSMLGLATGESLNPHDAWSFRYDTTRTDSRAGGKRFCGVSESYITNGSPNSIMLLRLVQLESQLESALQSTGNIWRPRVFGKRQNNLGQFLNPLAGVQYIGQYTQNTRKRYTRGIF